MGMGRMMGLRLEASIMGLGLKVRLGLWLGVQM